MLKSRKLFNKVPLVKNAGDSSESNLKYILILKPSAIIDFTCIIAGKYYIL